MAPKKRQREELKQEDVIQAVVIADSFNFRFAPVTKQKPRTLLPVANVPLLDYTIEFLCAAGVQEIFVFCCHLGDQIRTHIRNSKWNDAGSPCSVTTVMSEGCISMGEALREIDAKDIIRSDFILIYGDIVSNVKLLPILEEHKNRREKDKNMVMTVLFKKSPPGHTSRCCEDDVLLAVEQPSDKIIYYQRTAYKKKLDVPVEVLTDHKEVQIRYDLLDCQISICSPQVPQLFTDNFDYQTRDDFVKGILINEEIMGNSIYLDVLKDEYAARISNLHMYDAVSRDIICRWAYPFVPDNNNNRDNRVTYGRGNVYTSKDITLARGCILEENVVVGSGTCIGSNSVITQSVIGKDCKIGENVRIKGAYIWDNVIIEDNCYIDSTILCDDVAVYNNVTIKPGCMLAWQVKIGPNITLPYGTRLQSSPQEADEFGDLSELVDSYQAVVESSPDFGSKGHAYQYEQPTISDEDDDEVLQEEPPWGPAVQSDESESDRSTVNSESEGSESDQEIDDRTAFYMELIDTLKRAREINISNENIIVEINSLKHPYNIDIGDLQGTVVKAVIELPMIDNSDLEGSPLLVTVKKHLQKHLPLMRNYIKGPESQYDCLQALEEFGVIEPRMMSLFTQILHFMYEQLDILSEEAILKWYKSLPQDSDGLVELRKKVAPFIQWLQEAEEESSDEESD